MNSKPKLRRRRREPKKGKKKKTLKETPSWKEGVRGDLDEANPNETNQQVAKRIG